MAALRAREHDELLAGVGQAVRERRNTLGITRRALSERVGVSVRFIAELEAGRGNISIARLRDVAVGIGSTPAALLEDGSRRAKPRGVVALLGLRGAGKSTIGKRLARRLGVPFIELDAQVEETAGLSLGALFELHGEAHYRKLEREALRRVLAEHRAAVIATGGSLVTDEETYALLRAHAKTVWLQASPDSHWQRVVAQGDRRPMANRADAKNELRTLLRERAERYSRADIVVDTDVLGVDEIVRDLAQRVA